MNEQKKLAEHLLKQNGLAAGTATAEEQTRFRRILARDRARARRMKVGTIVSWGLLLACYAAAALKGHLSPQGGADGPGYWSLAVLALFYIAIACSVSWLLRSRSVTRRELLARLGDLEMKLESFRQHMAEQEDHTVGPPHKEE